jgi:DNA-binding NtrC family response regulator
MLTRPILLGQSSEMQLLHTDIEAAARSDAKVLLTGETGVGKEVVARTIHVRSRRQPAAFVTINCAGVPDSLLESEFFGHVRGSFTGAVRDTPGLLRQGHRGTVFMDEVGEMSLRMQALLLRFLETGELQTVGAVTANAPVDVRVITATNRDLLEEVNARSFREDLYYRLNVLHLKIPPLRERGTDIPLLFEHYLTEFSERHRMPRPTLSAAALQQLTAYAWPGNIRELRNVVERLVLSADGSMVEPRHLPAEINDGPESAAAAPAVEFAISHQARVDGMLARILTRRESFWTVVYPAFMSHDLTRDDLRFILHAGLERSQGSYRTLVELFNMNAGDYKRFVTFLKQHDCHLPFQRFRLAGYTDRNAAPAVPLGL